jgi:Holliday junction resolvasome RuvABC endonuclease subunit
VRVLAIDPGLAVTGWAVLTDGRVALNADGNPLAGSIRTSAQFGTVEERLGTIRRALLELVKATRPERVAIEAYTYQGPKSETGNALALSRIVGMAEALAETFLAPPLLLDKGAVNHALGLRGQCSKTRVRAMVEAALHLPAGLLRNEHEIDAAALGYVAGLRLRRAA